MYGSVFLLNGLPAARRPDRTVVFSPYNRTVTELPRDSKSDVIAALSELGCFGEPSLAGPSHRDNYDVTLLVTRDCNLRCEYCFADGGGRKEYMSDEVAVAALDHVFATVGRKRIKVSFFGGEPTLNMGLIRRVVEHVRAIAPKHGKEYAFAITSNGVISDDALSYLIGNGFIFVISMDGVPLVQDTLRPLAGGHASSRRVEGTLASLVASNARLMVRGTVTGYNLGRMEDGVEYLHGLGVRVLHYEPVTHAGRGRSGSALVERPDPDEFVWRFVSCLDLCSLHGMSLINSSYMNFLTPAVKFCDAMAGSRLVVTCAGDVSLCVEVQDTCHPCRSDAFVGHVDTRSQALALDHEKHRAIVSEVPIDRNAACTTCFARFSCGGGCPIKNHHATGHYGSLDDYRCRINRRLVANVLDRIYAETSKRAHVVQRAADAIAYDMAIPKELWMKESDWRARRNLVDVLVG